jgi:hypothetical protein
VKEVCSCAQAVNISQVREDPDLRGDPKGLGYASRSVEGACRREESVGLARVKPRCRGRVVNPSTERGEVDEAADQTKLHLRHCSQASPEVQTHGYHSRHDGVPAGTVGEEGGEARRERLTGQPLVEPERRGAPVTTSTLVIAR